MDFETSHLRPDGTTWPPVTPDPPPPPGYVDPIPQLDAAVDEMLAGEPVEGTSEANTDGDRVG